MFTSIDTLGNWKMEFLKIVISESLHQSYNAINSIEVKKMTKFDVEFASYRSRSYGTEFYSAL